MMELKRLIKLIDNIIKEKEAKKRKISKTELPSAILERAINKIKNSILDINNLANLEEIEIESLNKICDVVVIHNLKAYIDVMQAIKDGAVFQISEDSYQKIYNICNEIIQKFDNYKESKLLNNKKYENLIDEIKKLKKLKVKLNNSFDIESNDIDDFIKILHEYGIEEEEILEYIIFISCGFMEIIEQENFEIIQENTVELSLESVVSLFKEYGYDFNQLPEKQKHNILLKGNLNIIKDILEVLKENKIDLNAKMNKSTIFIARASQLTSIFIYSNANLVSSIINLSKNKIKLFKDGKIDFVSLIERPSIFIEGQKKLKEKPIIDNPGGQYVPREDIEEISGCYQDFTKNIELILEKYKEAYGSDVGFVDFFRKHKHKCVFEASHERIKNTINAFTMYEISPKYYLRALSSFSSANMLDILDISLELDCYNYVKDNPSKLIGKVNSELFEKIAISRIIGLSEFEIFKQKQRSGEVGNSQYIDFRATNISKIIEENNLKFNKFRLEDNFDKLQLSLIKEMEKCISKSSNNGMGLAVRVLENQTSKTILKSLEKLVDPNDKLVYNIEGIKISKNKVLRLYNTLKSYNFEENIVLILYILTKNSYLTQEQFEILRGQVEIMLEDVKQNDLKSKEKKL